MAEIVAQVPTNLKKEYDILFSEAFKDFITRLVHQFGPRLENLLDQRLYRRCGLDQVQDDDVINHLIHGSESLCPKEKDWHVGRIPSRLTNRHIDLGDVSPADKEALLNGLYAAHVNGLQVDFDDGHCPTWSNQLQGWYSIYKVVREVDLDQRPLLLFRPRAFNMVDRALMVDGKFVNGALLDFGLLSFHNAKVMLDNSPSRLLRNGPFFYLSKLEDPSEAQLWADLFAWTELELGIPEATFKATILIENILAAFKMKAILYHLKEYAIGLNCGMWDYAASIIAKMGHRKAFVLPDRHGYVNMERPFLKTYMKLVIKTCHEHGALATGGMAAQLDNKDLEKVMKAKGQEVEQGINGFLIYNPALAEPCKRLFEGQSKHFDHQLTIGDLLALPPTKVTIEGLKKNVTIGVLFIHAWLKGQGTFCHNGLVEDSATAEISRLQVWQWIRHQTVIENEDLTVSFGIVQEMCRKEDFQDKHEAVQLFLNLVSLNKCPEFLTTWLNETNCFANKHFFYL